MQYGCFVYSLYSSVTCSLLVIMGVA